MGLEDEAGLPSPTELNPNASVLRTQVFVVHSLPAFPASSFDTILVTHWSHQILCGFLECDILSFLCLCLYCSLSWGTPFPFLSSLQRSLAFKRACVLPFLEGLSSYPCVSGWSKTPVLCALEKVCSLVAAAPTSGGRTRLLRFPDKKALSSGAS